MPELAAIQSSSHPVTRARIAGDLGRLGVAPGGVLLVHSSLSALGWVCGGAQARGEPACGWSASFRTFNCGG